jgi:hypothetical protein
MGVANAIALRRVENVVDAKEGDVPLLARFLVLNRLLLPKYDRAAFLSLSHGASKHDGLAEGEPKG